MNQIKEWLESENKDYHTGINLLRPHTRNRQLLNHLSRKENQANKDKLAYELAKVAPLAEEPAAEPDILDLYSGHILFIAIEAGYPNAELETLISQLRANPEDFLNPANEPAAEPVSVPPVDNKPGSVSDSPLDEIVTEMQQLYNRRCQLSNTLADQATDEARAAVAADVLALQEAYNQLAEKKAYYEEHGKFPEAPQAPAAPELPTDLPDLLKKRGNLRSQVSKAKTAVEAKPQDVSKQEKLAKLLAELNEVDAKIKLLS